MELRGPDKLGGSGGLRGRVLRRDARSVFPTKGTGEALLRGEMVFRLVEAQA